MLNEKCLKSEYLVIFISTFMFRFQTRASNKISKTIKSEFGKEFYPSIKACACTLNIPLIFFFFLEKGSLRAVKPSFLS